MALVICRPRRSPSTRSSNTARRSNKRAPTRRLRKRSHGSRVRLPVTTQDHAFQLLGLAWARRHGESRVRRAFSRRGSGAMVDGASCPPWSRTPMPRAKRSSRSTAPGSMPVTDPVYQKGVEYLLRTQAADGSWHVSSRAIWLQPYFESGFPYGQDQFISTAGTAWASMALAAAAPSLAGGTSAFAEATADPEATHSDNSHHAVAVRMVRPDPRGALLAARVPGSSTARRSTAASRR